MSDYRHDPFPEEDEPGDEPGLAPRLEQEPEATEERAPSQVSTGIAWGVILLLVGVASVVIFSVQNTDPVPVRFLWMEGQFPFAIVILVTVGIIILLSELIGLSYRRRRRRRLAEREELRRYRAG